MHGYSSKFVYLQTLTSFDACQFHAILCKLFHFLYFTPTDKIALRAQQQRCFKSAPFGHLIEKIHITYSIIK